LAINRFAEDGIRLEGTGTNVVQANHLGTDPAGTLQRANLKEGITVNGCSGNLFGGTNANEGNLISGNGDAGIYLLNGGANRIQGNRIGTSVTGANQLGNANSGVIIYNSAGNIVGGDSAGSRNLISGNRGSGVYLFGNGSKGNYIQGNIIGADPAGKVSVGNVGDGITVFNAPGNFIGGSSSAQGNLLSGNGLAGLYLNGPSCSNNVVQGNLCGTDITGSSALGNSLAGIVMLRALGNQIGGTNLLAGNIISGNRESGILLSTNSFENQIAGNRIGVDASGGKPLGNRFNGVSVQSASWNVISGNVISGNTVYGCEISLGSSGNLLERNFIGTDATGQFAVGNSNSGVRVNASFNTIGHAEAGGGNVVSGNLQHGIFLVGSGSQSNLVMGNLVGLDSSGTKAVANRYAGVALSGAPRNVIGTVTSGNCISGNGDAGVYLFGSGATGNSVIGNRIGTAASGKSAVPNALEGIYSDGANSNRIGGVSETERNLISGNRTRGLFFTNSSWNIIQGNAIGTTADGLLPLPNGFFGIEFELKASNNKVGGSPETANQIAYSPAPYAGVRVRDGSINNSILCNSIFENGGLGIDLGQVGMDPLDPCDGDTGANFLQNSPVLTYLAAGQTLAIRGTLNSRPNADYVLQFYANPSCSPSGQGQLYLGQSSVHTDAQCRADFSLTLPSAVPIHYFATATATDSANNTSEFSSCQPVTAAPSLSVSTISNRRLLLAWPATAQGFMLHSTGSLAPPVVWLPVAGTPLLSNGQFVVTVPLGTSHQFYVLSFE
jgi:hypothetical protein